MQIRSKVAADLVLLSITVIWGLTFVTVKNSVTEYPVMAFLALRFGIALAALTPAALLKLGRGGAGKFGESGVKGSVLTGLFLFAGYSFQTAGLQFTSSGRAGFITGLSVIIIPLFAALFWQERQDRSVGLGIGLAVLGLGLLSFDGTGTGGALQGDLLVLLCAFAFAAHVLSIKHFGAMDEYLFSTVQIAVVTVLSGGFSLLSGQGFPTPSPMVWGAAAFTGLMATALVLILQTIAQRSTSATHTGVIFSMEPVFAAVAGYFLAGERLSSQALLGAALILAAMLWVEVGSHLFGKASFQPTLTSSPVDRK